MVRARVYGILAAYEDQNDHDALRHDPVFKLVAGRAPDGPDLASQPTLSRFENAVTIASLKRLRDVLIDQFIASFAEPPRSLTFDLDAVDDPTHGHQQLSLFHGYFDQYQYFPSFITSADTDQVVVLSPAARQRARRLGRRRRSGISRRPPAAGLARRASAYPRRRRLRRALDVRRVRAARPRLHLRPGQQRRPQARHSEALLAEATAAFAATGQPQRLFTGFGYQAGSWPTPRWVIVKAEAQAQGTNRRFIVTNRPGARVLPEPAYDDYARRGESENRNKELKCDLAIDRTSDHRFLANFFRLYLHALALNLLVRLRRAVACPPPVPTDTPVEALTDADRRRYFRRRRQQDPLGEGQPAPGGPCSSRWPPRCGSAADGS